jgi:Ca2+-binding RTX toxin-like protein
MRPRPTRLNAISIVLVSGFFLSSSALADYTATLSGDATMNGDAGGDTLIFTDGITLEHNRSTAGDLGFSSNADFDTVAVGDQTVSGIAVAVNAGDGNDIVNANGTTLATSFTLSGEGGDDILTSSSQQDFLDGGEGNDTLMGGSNNDFMFGGLGDDILVGGIGNDVMFGQEGSDTFEWNLGNGSDLIEGGADAGTDVLVFNGSNGIEIFEFSLNGSRVLFTRNVANIVMDLGDVEEIDLKAMGSDDVVIAVPLPDTVLVIDAGLANDTLNYDCQGGEIFGAAGAIQVVGNQPLFHQNFETVVLLNCIFTDTDGDGTVDPSDNCPEVDNPDQADSDTDGLGDVCDEDPEGDGFGAGDNCPAVDNAGQEDTDGDGMGDFCDADADDDGTLNGADNCPLTPNVDQADDDGDNIGNACDEPAPPPKDDTMDQAGGCSLVRR